jgi:O-methyltransferase
LSFLKQVERRVRDKLKGRMARYRARPIGRDFGKIFQLYDAICSVETVPGAFVECGVGHGVSLAHMTWFNQQLGLGREIWGFDSYQGFPEGSSEDRDGFDPKAMKDYEQFTVDWVRRYVSERTRSPELAASIHYVEGFFPETFAQYDDAPVALLHVDVDLYQSYADSLDHFWPLVSPGGIAVFDEYDAHRDLEKWPGAKIAIDAFLEREKLSLERHFSGYTMVRKPL